MNILALVFSILLILSYGFHVCWDKQLGSNRLRSSFIGHEKAHRAILNSYQSEVYKKFRVRTNPQEKSEEPSQEEPTAVQEKPKTPSPNRYCAKINLWPLIQEGREKHPLLYELTAKLLRTFYSSFDVKKKNFEYHFLDQLISSAKSSNQEAPFALEKIDFGDEDMQKIFYRMLKGTKKWDLATGMGYPSLLDYLKADPNSAKLCLFHAHPDLMTAIFNLDIALRIHSEIHTKNGPLLTKEFIEHVCSEYHLISIDQELFDLLELGRPHHEENQKVFIAQEQDVVLRKNISFN